MYIKVIIEDLQSEKSGKETNQYQINLYKEIFIKECKLKERISRDESVWTKTEQERKVLKQAKQECMKAYKANPTYKFITSDILLWS